MGGPRRGSGCQCRRGYHLGAEGSEAGFGQLGSPGGGGGGPGRGAGAAASPPRAGAAPEGAERAQRRRRHGFRGQRARPAAPGGAAQAGGRRGADQGARRARLRPRHQRGGRADWRSASAGHPRRAAGPRGRRPPAGPGETPLSPRGWPGPARPRGVCVQWRGRGRDAREESSKAGGAGGLRSAAAGGWRPETRRRLQGRALVRIDGTRARAGEGRGSGSGVLTGCGALPPAAAERTGRAGAGGCWVPLWTGGLRGDSQEALAPRAEARRPG